MALLVVSVLPLYFLFAQLAAPNIETSTEPAQTTHSDEPLAAQELAKLTIADAGSKDGYARDKFGNGWARWDKCDTRQRILNRDLRGLALDSDGCTVLSGVLDDPYTGKTIDFTRGTTTSGAVQIDHVVALANAWISGASTWEKSRRVELANDELELLAVDGPANMQKGASAADAWLPPYQPFRCQYVARQIAIKIKYALSVTSAEHGAMEKVLHTCPAQRLPTP